MIKGVSGIAFSVALAYTLAVRFTEILFLPRGEKIFLISFFIIITTVITAWITMVLLPLLIRPFKSKTLFILALTGFLLTSLLFAAVYSPPPFPEKHYLTISVEGRKNPLSDGASVNIASISTVSLPTGAERSVPITGFIYDGVWQGSIDNFSLSTDGSQPVSLEYEKFMQAGMKVKFISGPASGIVKINWDGNESEVDLYAPDQGEKIVPLAPALNWRTADRTRQVLVAGALLTDLISTSTGIFLLLISAATILSGRKFELRKPSFLLLGLMVTAAAFLFVFSTMQPVVFENPQLEAVIRTALDKPQGPVYARQLRTIASLDASSSGITDINGIGILTELKEIDLSHNHLTDISPLADLPHLEKLNLRNNQIVDLEHLRDHQNLEYLNIHSNPNIRSIEPLKNFYGLETLIMAGVPIRDQEHIVKDLVNLNYLNLRDTGISDLSAIASLTDLEYLNLHSNPEITSLAPLEGLDHLRTLILAHVPIGTQAEMLASFEQLRYLNLRDTHLEDISFLSNLHRLKYLNLHSNPQIASIQPLAGLTSLEHLILRGVNVADQTSTLSNLTALQTLNLRDTGIADVAFLGDLMAQGALQDNPKLNILARLDIRDNPIPDSVADLYKPLRPNWENISFASPVALPFHSSVPAPKFSHTSGFYDSEFTLTLTPPEPGLVIHYTLDSSSPTADSPEYAQPILIQDLSGESDVIASIEAISADWNKPDQPVRKAQVVRAAAFNPITGKASEIITQTFFVNPNGRDKHTLPVISFVTDKEHLFDDQTGIYMLGDAYIKARENTPSGESVPVLENFHQRGRGWERPLSIELIDAGGTSLFSQNSGVRIHGSSSRQRPQKSLRLIARPEYDEEALFTYPLFDDGPENPEYEVFLMRNAGQDWMVSMIRDTVAQSLVSHTNLNTQGTQPVIAYLNGEYWGIYHLQERIDEFYLRNHFGIPLDQSVILRNNKQVFRGQPEDGQHYRNMLAFAQDEDLSSDENYQFMETLLDVDNYLDYMSANIIMGNTDWPHNNLYYWRKTTDAYLPDAPYGHDGRWRWMLFDLDWAFGFEGIGGGVNNNTLQLAQKDDWTGLLFKSLLENQEFRDAFINRMNDHLNSTFVPDRVVDTINAHQSILAPEMEEFFARWTSREDAIQAWNAEVEMMREFARLRPDIVRDQIEEQFGLGEPVNLTLTANPEMGYIRVNTLDITQGLSGLSDPSIWIRQYYRGIPLTITAVPNPGYAFAGWEGVEMEEREIKILLESDMDIKAVFTEK